MKKGSGAVITARTKGAFLKATLNDSGAALLMVLFVMAVLMIVVSEFVYTMKVENLAFRNFKDGAQAYYLAVAGINMGIAEVSRDFDLVCLDNNGSITFKKKRNGSLKGFDAKRKIPLGGGTVGYSISDEKGKININSADMESITEVLRITGVGMVERHIIVDSILDWRDSNDEHRMNGAETDYYSSLPHPYISKNGPLDTVEELLLVRGITPEILYGSAMVPSELTRSESVSGRDFKGIARYITVWGDGRVNINSAGELVLSAALGTGTAHEVMARRAAEGFFERPAYGGAVTSETFLIKSVGEVSGMRVEIKGVVERIKGSGEVRTRYWKVEG